MTEQRHKQRTPPEWAAASSWSDHADAEEEEQNASFLEMPHHQQSNDYYDEINEEDIIISDENGEYNYGMQEMKDFTHHDGLADENNDEVASVHTNGHYEGNDYYNENEQVQFFDDDGYLLDHHDESGYQSHDNDGGGSMHDDYYAQNNSDADHAEEEEMHDDGYYHHDEDNNDYPNEDQYHPFDIGNLQQLPYPPSLDFGGDDNRYEADDECHFDDDDFGQEEQDGDDEYEQSQDEYEANELPQLSAESLDVVHRIEVLMERIFATLDNMEAPQITGYKGPSNDDDDDSSSYEESRDAIASNLNENGDQNFCRAWSNIGQCRTFTSICLVLSFIHQLLLSMRTTTTREVYYVFVTHFRSQRECDSAILDVAKVLGVSRRSLGLSASPKGWFCGSVEITRRGTLPSGKDVSGTIDGTALSSIQGLPITREWIERDEEGRNEQGVEISVSSKDAKCILVIEKEGVFNRLSEERLYDRFPCIMVTGKGFPDLCTRALVKALHEELDLPVLGLCDMNPYGISVLSVYFCAGDRMGVDGNYRYSVPIEWMGLRPTDFAALHEKHRLPNTVFQALTDLDRKRMDSLTDEMSPYLDEDEKDEVSEEMKYKVELEALYWLGADFLGDWVFNKLQARFE